MQRCHITNSLLMYVTTNNYSEKPTLSQKSLSQPKTISTSKTSLTILYTISPIIISPANDSMDAIWQAISPGSPSLNDYSDLDFWVEPERVGWLSKQGEYIRTWRRRWFVLKRGKLLWFKDPADVTPTAVPRGVIKVGRCQAVKSAEDIINKPNSLQIYVDGWPVYLVADSDKEKEEWINSIGRAIVQHSGAITPDIHDYNH